MATLYSTVYDAAIFNFKDEDILALAELDADAIMYSYLLKAIADFTYICEKDLSDRTEASEQFNETLSEVEIQILALGIAVHWTRHQVYFTENLRDKMSSRDYSYHSRGNLLASLYDTLKYITDEYEKKMYDYSYDVGDLSLLKV